MIQEAKYVHTNLMAEKVARRLSHFLLFRFRLYAGSSRTRLLRSCTRSWYGNYRCDASGYPSSLTGYGVEGPTLEIFNYSRACRRPNPISESAGVRSHCLCGRLSPGRTRGRFGSRRR